MPSTPLTETAAGLYHKIERYVLQNIDNPKLGRGTQLNYVHRPLADPSKPWLWRKGGQAFSAQIEIRLQQHLHRSSWDQSKLQHLQKLGWHLADNWHGEAKVTLEGFKLLFDMLWTNHDEEHIQVLLRFAKEQRTFHTEDKEASIGAAFGTCCCRMSKHPKTSGGKPLLGFLEIILRQMSHKDRCSRSTKKPLSYFRPQAGHIDKCERNGVLTLAFCRSIFALWRLHRGEITRNIHWEGIAHT